jgi:hypothetical protein
MARECSAASGPPARRAHLAREEPDAGVDAARAMLLSEKNLSLVAGELELDGRSPRAQDPAVHAAPGPKVARILPPDEEARLADPAGRDRGIAARNASPSTAESTSPL